MPNDSCLYNQDAIAQDYAATKVFKRKEETGHLHMFFSPSITPTGLEDNELRICIDLYVRKVPVRDYFKNRREKEMMESFLHQLEDDYTIVERYREDFSRVWGERAFELSAEDIAMLISSVRNACYDPLPLPRELLTNPMTRESFSEGIRVFTKRLEGLEREMRILGEDE